MKRLLSRRGLVASSVGAVAAVGIGVIPARCAGKIYPGVSVLGIDVSGMTPQDGELVLRERLGGFERHAATFVLGDQSWKASLADLGMLVDYDSLVATAMNTVRRGGVVDRYTAFLDPDSQHAVPLYLRENRNALDAYLASIAADVAIEARDARLYKSGASVEVLPHRVGRTLNVGHAKREALRLVRSGVTATIELRTDEVSPLVTSADLEDVKERAYRLVSEPVVFTLNDAEYVVASEQLAHALTVAADNTVAIDTEKMQARVDQIAADIFVPAKNVMLGWSDGPYVVEPDVDGIELDRESFVTLLHEVASSDDRITELPVKAKRAAARVDNLHELGLDAHLAAGSSSFAGSSYERAENVTVSARNVSYKLVGPGEEFSFNDLLGPITEEYGYISGSIIQGDFAATDIGGGVCQVSTTVFRAAQSAGFRFSEWNPHSWRLAFYEADGSSPGLDAAIYQPNNEWEYELDLTFVNPLDSWLLLQVVVEGEWVSAHFYGKDPGWTVDVFPARISDPKPIPEPVEKMNPDLAPGERRMVQTSSPGYTVWVRRRVTAADGTLLSDGDFVSDYVSQPEAWEVGPS